MKSETLADLLPPTSTRVEKSTAPEVNERIRRAVDQPDRVFSQDAVLTSDSPSWINAAEDPFQKPGRPLPPGALTRN